MFVSSFNVNEAAVFGYTNGSETKYIASHFVNGMGGHSIKETCIHTYLFVTIIKMVTIDLESTFANI